MVGNLVYDTNTLVKVVPNLKTAQTFFLDRYFPGIIMSDSEFVSLDIVIGKRRLSPFCSPLVEGRLVEQLRYQTNTFKPPYIKDKRAPDLRKPIRRMVGERIGGGEMTGAQREMANIEEQMTDQIDMLRRRMEWMAVQELTTGTVVIAGDGFPTTLIDFGRDPTLTVALTGSAMWTPANIAAGNASPSANIETWQHNVLKKSGATMTDLIFTTTAYEMFLLDPRVQGAVIYPRFQESGNVLNPGAQIVKGAVLKGQWGQYSIYVYNDWYVDENNVEKSMLTDGTVILAGPMIEGIQAHAQIIDPSFNYASLPYAPKTWIEQDPAQRVIMMQSAPLPILSRPNASFSASVTPAQVF